MNADDFGLSKGVNLGIIKAFRYGVVTSTTVMMNMDEVEQALSLLKDNPLLRLGIHLVLTAGRPVCPDVPSLTDERGYFRKQSELMAHAKGSDIKKELECQVEKLLSYGIAPTHIDGHHHVQTHPEVLHIVVELAQSLNIPVRLYREDVQRFGLHGKVRYAGCFSDRFYGDDVTVETVLNILDASCGCDVVEIMCHPAYVDEKLMKSSKYNVQRSRELSVLTDPALKRALKTRGIELISYADI